MPGLRVYYRLEGDDSRPVVMFAHSLGVDHGQWFPQAAALQDRFRILRYDIRGHGASEVAPGEYTIEMLGRDALALADALGIERFALCGLSIGGMIAQWVAAHAPERVPRLALANTSARTADPGPMEQRRQTVLREGMAAVADAAMGRFFTPESIAAGLPSAATTRRTVLATDPAGYAGCCAAVRDLDHMDLLSGIAAPTLVIGGERDSSTPWSANGAVIAAKIPGARTAVFPSAHLSNLECAEAFNEVLTEFLAS